MILRVSGLLDDDDDDDDTDDDDSEDDDSDDDDYYDVGADDSDDRLIENIEIDNSTPFELLASGLWFNNINLIKEAINDGIDTNQCLCELFFVSYVLNGNTEELDETLEFV